MNWCSLTSPEESRHRGGIVVSLLALWVMLNNGHARQSRPWLQQDRTQQGTQEVLEKVEKEHGPREGEHDKLRSR